MTSNASKAVSYGAVAVSTVVGFAQSFDSGMIAAGIGVVGLAVMGLLFEYRRRRIEAWKLDESARRENERLEVIAKNERDQLALDAEIALNERREKAYATSLTQQIARLQRCVEEGNRRVEDANAKLHELRQEANAAKLQFLSDREELKERLTHQEQQVARSEAENRRLMQLLNGKVESNRAAIKESRAAIADLRSGSGDNLPAAPPPPEPAP